MLIARLTDGSLVLGLSHENLRRLKAGRPIRVTKDSHPGAPLEGLPRILIMSGRTENDVRDELRAAEKVAH